jgi:hypothetical protein
MAGEPGDFDRAPVPEWPSGPVYGQVPPAPPPAAEPESRPSQKAWFLALAAFLAVVVVEGVRYQRFDSAYDFGGMTGTAMLSLVVAFALLAASNRLSGRRGEAWQPPTILTAACLVIALSAATWDDNHNGSAPATAFDAFRGQAESCRSSSPSPLVTGGVLSFHPVDVTTSQSVDTMLTQTSPAMESLVQVSEVSDGDLTPAMAFAVPGFSDPTLRAGFVAGLQNSAAQAGGSSVPVPTRGVPITLLQVGPRYVASSFDDCYAVMVAAPSQSAALRIEQEILGPG